MATQDDIIQAIRAADKAGDSASVRKLGAYLKTLPAQAAPEPTYDPTEGMSTTEKFLAGTGKAFADLGRGVGQMVGLVSQEEVDEAKRLDAPLMRTTAGTVGNVTGNVAAALPTVFIPGAQGLAGAALTGAGMGLIQPVASDESRLKNVAIGGAAGAGGVVAGRVLAAGAKGAKALVEPFTDKGRQAIAGRTLGRFGVQAGDLAGVSNAPTVTGAVPTMAERIVRPEGAAGAARLQDSVRSLDPEIANKFVAREVGNNAARVGTLRDMAGHDGARDFTEAMRNSTAKEQYDKAFATRPAPVTPSELPQLQTPVFGSIDPYLYHGSDAGARQILSSGGLRASKDGISGPGLYLGHDLDGVYRYVEPDATIYRVTKKDIQSKFPKSQMEWDEEEFILNGLDKRLTPDMLEVKTPNGWKKLVEPAIKPQVDQDEVLKLMNVPAIRNAAADAREIAANKGMDMTSPEGSIEGLHLMKLAMDDAITSASKGGSAVAVNKAMSIKTARDRLVKFIERMAPDYAEARGTYAAMSKPLNQMDVADALFRKGTSATSDLGGTPRLMPDKFVNLLKNEEATVKGATGRDLGKLSEVLDPDQFSKVMAVGQELDKAAAVARAANGPGSATAQRLASQNVLRQILGPTGLPQSWAESTMLNTAMRPVQFAYNGVAEPKIQAVLADLLLDPTKARAALQAARTAPQTLPNAVREAIPYLEQAMKASIPAAALAGQR